MKVELLNMVDTVNAGLVKLKPLVKSYITDEKNSLEDRWDVYSTVPESFFDIDGCYADFTLDGEEICWSSKPHYIEERGRIVDNVDVIERYEELMVEGVYGYDPSITKETIDDLKRQMLMSGHREWKNDW